MDQLRIDSAILHPEVQAVRREDIKVGKRMTLPYYTKYEYTTMVGIRAQQLADGAKPLVPLNGFDTSSSQFVTRVAEREIKDQVLPFIIHRRLPTGVSEYWSASELSIMW